MKHFHEQTYYELLDVASHSSQEEILKAYNRARSTYGNNSPALYSLFNKEEAQELLKLIDEAYTVLSNPYKRKQYDQESERAPPAGPPVTTSEIKSEAVPEVEETPAEAVPSPAAKVESPGLGATIFSRYKMDENFEDQIKNCENYSGEMLNKIRLYKNVTLDQISEMTKVSRAYLVAVESDNYSSLPAPVFIRGFLVQISKILNLDVSKVASSYLGLMKERLKK